MGTERTNEYVLESLACAPTIVSEQMPGLVPDFILDSTIGPAWTRQGDASGRGDEDVVGVEVRGVLPGEDLGVVGVGVDGVLGGVGTQQSTAAHRRPLQKRVDPLRRGAFAKLTETFRQCATVQRRGDKGTAIVGRQGGGGARWRGGTR